MIYKYHDLRHTPILTVLYGFAYTRQNNRTTEGKSYFSKPVLGAIVSERTKKRQLENKYPGHSERYFVPLKANTCLKPGQIASVDDLTWSKLVHISARTYGDNLDECYHCYDSKVIHEAKESLLSTQTDLENLHTRLPKVEALYAQLMQELQTAEKGHKELCDYHS